MRIRNGAEFLRLTIESHLPYYDEIVACYNDCSDATESILADLAARHPGRVRPVHYVPKVHPPCSAGHRRESTRSLHSLANYYNFCLAQARYSTVVKLDDDHLAIPAALARCTATVRADLERGVRKLYTFSGINLVRDADSRLAVHGRQPFAGTGDIMYFPVSSRVHWVQGEDCENLAFHGLRLPKEYMGLLFFHLKYLKPDLGLGYLEPELRERLTAEFLRTLDPVPIDEFCSKRHVARLVASHDRLEYWIRTQPLLRALLQAIGGRQPPLRICRLQRLATELPSLDWEDLYRHVPYDAGPVRHAAKVAAA